MATEAQCAFARNIYAAAKRATDIYVGVNVKDPSHDAKKNSDLLDKITDKETQHIYQYTRIVNRLSELTLLSQPFQIS